MAAVSNSSVEKRGATPTGVFSNTVPDFNQSQLRFASLGKCFEVHEIANPLNLEEGEELFGIFQSVNSIVLHTLADFLSHAISREYDQVINYLRENNQIDLMGKYEKQQRYFHETAIALAVDCQFKRFLEDLMPQLKTQNIMEFPKKIDVINTLFSSELPAPLKETVAMTKTVELWKKLIAKEWYIKISTQDFLETAVEAVMRQESQERERIKSALDSTSISQEIQPSEGSIESRIQNTYAPPEEVIFVLTAHLKMNLAFYEKCSSQSTDPLAGLRPSGFIKQMIDSLCALQNKEPVEKKIMATQIINTITAEMHRVDGVGAKYKKNFEDACRLTGKVTDQVAITARIAQTGQAYKRFCSYLSLLRDARASIDNTINREQRCLCNRLYENLGNYVFVGLKMKKAAKTYPDMLKDFNELLGNLVEDKKLFDECAAHVLAKPDEAQNIDKNSMLQLYADMFPRVKDLTGLDKFQLLQKRISTQARDLYNSGETKKAQEMQNVYYELCMNLIPVFLCLHDIRNFQDNTFCDESYINERFLDCFFLEMDVSEPDVESDEEGLPTEDSFLKTDVPAPDDEGRAEVPESKEPIKTDEQGPKTLKQKVVSALQKPTIPRKDKKIPDFHTGTKKRDLIKDLCKQHRLVEFQGKSHTLLKTPLGRIVGIVPRGSKNLPPGTFNSIIKMVQTLESA